MWIIELIMDLADLVYDIWFARRYGWGSFLWGLATMVCILTAGLSFAFDLGVLCVISVIAAVTCTVMSCRQALQDIRKKHEEKARFRENTGEGTADETDCDS